VQWWGWLLIGWVFLAGLTAAWLGAAASVARGRERAIRGHQYGDAMEQEWQGAVDGSPFPPEPVGPAQRRRRRAQRTGRC
jgi:hypothetical protein